MREILFRGKDALVDEWLYGDLIQSTIENDEGDEEGVKFIVPFAETSTREILPETIGQFTGCRDKNGTKIFEGDIVRHIQKYEISGEVESTAVIIWNEAYSCWSVKYLNGRVTVFLGCEHSKIEVISNVYDNPELLKGE